MKWLKKQYSKFKLWWVQRKQKRAVAEKLKKLQKKDPFIYK
jgi:hypothetical protein